jgi:hypothetical protein
MPSLAEKNAKKHQSACLSKSAAMISATKCRIDSQVINNALLIWTDTKSHRFNHSAITKALSLAYRSEKSMFVMTMYKDEEYHEGSQLGRRCGRVPRRCCRPAAAGAARDGGTLALSVGSAAQPSQRCGRAPRRRRRRRPTAAAEDLRRRHGSGRWGAGAQRWGGEQALSGAQRRSAVGTAWAAVRQLWPHAPPAARDSGAQAPIGGLAAQPGWRCGRAPRRRRLRRPNAAAKVLRRRHGSGRWGAGAQRLVGGAAGARGSPRDPWLVSLAVPTPHLVPACSGARFMAFCETRRRLDLARCGRRSARLTLAGPACAARARAIRRRRGVWLIAPYVRLGEPTAPLTPRGT